MARLRAWQLAAPRDRMLVLEGTSGLGAVTLRERRDDRWFLAGYSAPDSAARALAAGFVRWRAAPATAR